MDLSNMSWDLSSMSADLSNMSWDLSSISFDPCPVSHGTGPMMFLTLSSIAPWVQLSILSMGPVHLCS
ncbi:hypothetical protein TNCV_1731731 [Trichonephila clavipes]|nr:hypothetical protein TNCV_1731731 [Trichonephila clavipes]